MIGTTCKVLALLAGVALVATAGVGVVSTVHDAGESAGHAPRHAHGVMHGGHGDTAHHEHMGHMAALIEELDLTPDQQAGLDRIHEALAGLGDGGPGSLAGLHDELVAQFEAGPLEPTALRGAVDVHLEQMRSVGYRVADEVTALVNGLDERQRAILHEHLAGIEGDVR